MLESNLTAIDNDVRKLVNDAQALFQAAAALPSEKAEEARARGMHLLDSALTKAKDAQAIALVKSKKIAASADDYIKENPWRVVAAAAGVGLLSGVLLGATSAK